MCAKTVKEKKASYNERTNKKILEPTVCSTVHLRL